MSTPDPTKSGRVYVYLGLVVAATWLLDLPAVLASRGVLSGKMEDYLGLVGLGALAPAVLAFVFQKREGKRLRELLGPTGAVRRAPLLFLVAPLVSGLALTLGLVLVHALGFEVGRFFYFPDAKERFIAAAIFPVFEEIGWRGYALPRLLPRLGRWRASLVLGGVWALWHVMMMLTTSSPLGAYVASVPFFVAGSYVFSWFFERTGGSLLIAILLHLGAHLDNSNLALPDPLPFYAHTLGFVLLALALGAYEARAKKAASGTRA
jgi:uncharacterized protein